MAVNSHTVSIEKLTSRELITKIEKTKYAHICDILRQFKMAGKDLLQLQEFQIIIKLKQFEKDKVVLFKELCELAQKNPQNVFECEAMKPKVPPKPNSSSFSGSDNKNKDPRGKFAKGNHSTAAIDDKDVGKISQSCVLNDDINDLSFEQKFSTIRQRFLKNTLEEVVRNSASPQNTLKRHLNNALVSTQKDQDQEEYQNNTSLGQNEVQNFSNKIPLETDSQEELVEYVNQEPLPEVHATPIVQSSQDVDELPEYINTTIESEQSTSDQSTSPILDELVEYVNDQFDTLKKDFSSESEHSSSPENISEDSFLSCSETECAMKPDALKIQTRGNSSEYVRLKTEADEQIYENENEYSAAPFIGKDSPDEEPAIYNDIEEPPPLPYRPDELSLKPANIKVFKKNPPLPPPNMYDILPKFQPCNDDDEYEVAVQEDSPLYRLQQNKFFKNVGRKEGAQILENTKVGSYLLRLSTQPEYFAVLMVKGRKKIQNVPMQYSANTQTYSLITNGPSKKKERTFKFVCDLLAHYTNKECINGDNLITQDNNWLPERW